MSMFRELTRDERPTVTNLGRLIARMALDEALHQRYLDDAETVIAEAGLDAVETAALVSQDWKRILRELGPKPRPAVGGGSGDQTGGEG